MFDEDGKPPPDLTEAKLAEQLPGDEAPDQLAAFLAAMSQGRQSKKELRAAIQAAVESELSIGSTIGALEPKASDSPTASSGGDSQKPNSTPESTAGLNSSDSTTAEPGPSLLPSAT
jgi:anthranilate phosphoribosyltransferase